MPAGGEEAVWSALVLLACCAWPVKAFNLDLHYPLVYTSEQRGDFFGFSVALHPGRSQLARDVPWLLVGAPRARNPDWLNKTTGRSLHCPLDQLDANTSGITPCTQIHLGKYEEEEFWSDVKNATVRKETIVQELMKAAPEGMMLGSVQDLLHGQLVVCAPRFRVVGKHIDRYPMLGKCYRKEAHEPPLSNHVTKIEPLNFSLGYRTRSVKNVTHFYHIFGESGFSMYWSNYDNSSIMFGAPGVFNWQGSTVLYETMPNKSIVPNPYGGSYQQQSVDGLLGYAVTSGRFYSKSNTVYVAGAPRGKSHGVVILFTYPEAENYGQMKILEWLAGHQVGEYFGAALASGDLNGDGLDDLLVGAPLFSRDQDEGRVFVFLGSTKLSCTSSKCKNNLETGDKINGTMRSGRFGMAISFLGDLDRDGYSDVAIAAPYAEGGSGVVYIYRGGREQLQLSHTVRGKDFSPNIKGFGFSISRGQDVDHNGYNDVAIGAYQSGHAVLLRSRPVAKLHVNVITPAELLPTYSTNLTLDICAWWTGYQLPRTIDVWQTVEADVDYGRLTPKYEKTPVQLENGSCFSQTFELNDTNKVFEPMTFRLNYRMEEKNKTQLNATHDNKKNTASAESHFCKTCPILSPPSVSKEVHVYFQTGCQNSTCQPQLSTTLHFLDQNGSISSSFVVGSRSELRVRLTVSNAAEGDPAHAVQLEVQLPTKVRRLPPLCQSNELLPELVVCDVAKTLQLATNSSVDLTVTAPECMEEECSTYTVTSRSKDQNKYFGEQATASLELTYLADVNVAGQPGQEIVLLGSESHRERNASNQFLISYKVSKYAGPSPIKNVTLTILIPVASNGLRFIKEVEVRESSRSAVPIECAPPQDHPAPLSDLEGAPAELSEEGYTPTPPPQSAAAARVDLPPNSTLLVSCARDWQCEKITCSAGPFPRQVAAAILHVELTLNLTVLEPLMGKETEFIYYETKAEIQIVQPTHVKSFTGDRAEPAYVGAKLQRTISAELDLKVVIGAAIGGVLLLLLLFSGLCKAGFFKRKEKEALTRLKREDFFPNVQELDFSDLLDRPTNEALACLREMNDGNSPTPPPDLGDPEYPEKPKE